MSRIIRLFVLPAVLLWSSVTLAWASPDRVALVIGMAEYEAISPLTNTRNDSEALADTLTEIGFDVTRVVDASLSELRTIMKDFSFRSETADLALIYFAGHGIEVQGENFLIPIDARPQSNIDVQNQSVSLKEMLAVVEKARVMRIVILDSCRDNPLGGSIDTNAVVQSALNRRIRQHAASAVLHLRTRIAALWWHLPQRMGRWPWMEPKATAPMRGL